MSDHIWTQEQIAAAVAGGLTSPDAERFDAHIRDCPECAAALADARKLDGGLSALFVGVRPGPGLEDRSARTIRLARRRLAASVWARSAAAVAAVLLLGALGATAGSVLPDGQLPLPGGTFASASRIHREAMNHDQRLSFLEDISSTSVTLLRDSTFNLDVDKDAPSGKPGNGTSLPSAHYMRHFNGGVAGHGNHEKRPALENPDIGIDNTLESSVDTTTMDERTIHSKIVPKVGGLPKRGYFDPNKLWTDTYTNGKPPLTGSGPDKDRLGGKKSGDTNGPATPETILAIQTKPSAPPVEPAPAVTKRVVIRSGDIDFEVESFDSAVAAVTKLVTAIPGAFIGTVNSDKLPNGKVKGAVVVRVPPDQLDGLVLDLRRDLGKGGELKGMKIGSTDITKQYTDLESRLKAARAMEVRLLQIIKDGKGEIKQLLEAERELGLWRTKIEETEGELRYYSNLAALSTLTISLAEKDLRQAAAVSESERVQAGIEVEDVEQAHRSALTAVTEAKGRVTRSELKQLSAGQFNATLHFEIAPDAAGPVRDRLKQLGRMARLEVDRVQSPESGAVPKDAKVKHGDTVFLIQLYNLANVAPRETVTLQVAVPDVATAYQALRESVSKTKGRILTANLDEKDRQNVTGQLDFEVPRTDEGATSAAMLASGETMSRVSAKTPEADNTTDSKVLFRTTLVSLAKLKPRDTVAMTIESADVDATTAAIKGMMDEAKGRQLDARVEREANGNVKSQMAYDVPLTEKTGLVERLKSIGTVRKQEAGRDPQVSDGKYATARLIVTIANADLIVADGDGVWPQVRKGLSYSASVLLVSVSWLVFGLCVVLPWAVVGWGGYRLVRRVFRRSAPTAT